MGMLKPILRMGTNFITVNRQNGVLRFNRRYLKLERHQAEDKLQQKATPAAGVAFFEVCLLISAVPSFPAEDLFASKSSNVRIATRFPSY